MVVADGARHQNVDAPPVELRLAPHATSTSGIRQCSTPSTGIRQSPLLDTEHVRTRNTAVFG